MSKRYSRMSVKDHWHNRNNISNKTDIMVNEKRKNIFIARLVKLKSDLSKIEIYRENTFTFIRDRALHLWRKIYRERENFYNENILLDEEIEKEFEHIEKKFYFDAIKNMIMSKINEKQNNKMKKTG